MSVCQYQNFHFISTYYIIIKLNLCGFKNNNNNNNNYIYIRLRKIIIKFFYPY